MPKEGKSEPRLFRWGPWRKNDEGEANLEATYQVGYFVEM